jgi:hypothetical protein
MKPRERKDFASRYADILEDMIGKCMEAVAGALHSMNATHNAQPSAAELQQPAACNWERGLLAGASRCVHVQISNFVGADHRAVRAVISPLCVGAIVCISMGNVRQNDRGWSSGTARPPFRVLTAGREPAMAQFERLAIVRYRSKLTTRSRCSRTAARGGPLRMSSHATEDGHA